MLVVSDLTRIFANRFDNIAGGVRDASFDLPAGTFFTLLGPSGCGKTTTLRCLAGLEKPDAGRIVLDGRTIFDAARGVLVPAHERGIGMVFQSYAIWPHMTVFENVAFPLQVARPRVAHDQIAAKVERSLTTVGLAGYGPRPATRLSGGQQQRVALARAIVHEPKLLLLDEPLSNLDAALRDEMRGELRRLQQEIGVTTVYVTHDQTEALALSDRIAVMDGGRIVQLDAPREIYTTPVSQFVARFIGAANILAGIAEQSVRSGDVGAVRLAGGERILVLFSQAADAATPVHVAVRPENLTLAAPDADANETENVLPAILRSVNFLGSATRCDVEMLGETIRMIVPGDVVPSPGTAIAVHFSASQAIALTK